MKILMYGFGLGNNIEPWLDFFKNNSNKFELTFICTSFQFDKKDYPDVKIIELKQRLFRLVKLIFFLMTNRFDVLYIHGFYDFTVRFLLLVFTRVHIKCLNIWNNTNYKKATNSNPHALKRYCYHFLLSRVDRLYFTWYGTMLEFEELLPVFKSKIHLNPWGLRKKVLDIDYKITPDDEFFKNYLSKIKTDEFFLFWPETMSEHEHVDKFIRALGLLKDKYPLRVLLFSAHQKENDSYIVFLKSIIKELNLTFIDLIVGRYISFKDIMGIWEKTNLAIKLSTKDQLSSGILEALYYRNPMILNEWTPYIKLKELGINVYISKLSSENIAKKLEEILNNLVQDKNYFKSNGESNRDIIKTYFNFEENIQKIFTELKEEFLN